MRQLGQLRVVLARGPAALLRCFPAALLRCFPAALPERALGIVNDIAEALGTD